MQKRHIQDIKALPLLILFVFTIPTANFADNNKSNIPHTDIAIFDYNTITTCSLNPSFLIFDAVILNKSFSFYKAHQNATWTICGMILLLMILLSIILVNAIHRQRNKANLQVNKEQYKLIYETSTDAIMTLVPPDWKFASGNKKIIEIFGVKDEKEFLSLQPWQLSPEYQPNGQRSDVEAKKMIEIAMKKGEHFFEWTHKKLHGDNFFATVLLNRVEVENKTFLQARVSDITEKRKAEEELLKMRKLKSIGTLAGGIAHDFNNVLLGIFGNIALAKREIKEDHPAYSLILEAEKAMNRATSLTNQLLTFAKGGTPIKQTIKMSDIIKDISRFTLSGSNVKPVITIPQKGWLTEADKGQIEQVVSNLIINADQAMPEGGNLYITLENIVITKKALPHLNEGKYVKITIRDEGTGISHQHLDHIFDPYFTTKQTGNGLGLATTYSIINKHNGYIGVSSILGKGTTFTLYLPASFSQKSQGAATTVTKIPLPNEKGKALVMDDEVCIRKLTEKMLIRNGFSVETAKDGRQAIDKYKESMKKNTPFDIVLMDLTIPGGMGGKETIKKLLKIDPEAKVIVFSGYSKDPIIADYANYGFKGRLTKPFKLETLKQELSRVMSS